MSGISGCCAGCRNIEQGMGNGERAGRCRTLGISDTLADTIVVFPSVLGYYQEVRIFKNTWFARYASRENISDSELKEAVNLLEAGQADANLGGNVYKVRVARPGKGKSGGYRVIVLFKSGERTFYMYGFAKSERENIDKKELNNFKKVATDYFSMTDKQINETVKDGKLIEL